MRGRRPARSTRDEGLGRTYLFDERLQIPTTLFRPLSMHRVADLGVDLQSGAGDRRGKPLLFFAREEGVLLPHKINVGTSISLSSFT
jgi:hypothetical protein